LSALTTAYLVSSTLALVPFDRQPCPFPITPKHSDVVLYYFSWVFSSMRGCILPFCSIDIDTV
jgi:hypothetical protein